MQMLFLTISILFIVTQPTYGQYEKEAGKLLFQDVTYPTPAGPGKVAYIRTNDKNQDPVMELYLGDMKTGTETRVLPNVDFHGAPCPAFAWSPDGSEFMIPQLSSGSWELFRYKTGSRTGEKVTNLLPHREKVEKEMLDEKGWSADMFQTITQMAYSPSGKRLIIKLNRPGKTALWWIDAQTGAERQATENQVGSYGCFAPGDEKICYTVNKQEMERMRANEDILLRDLKSGAVDTLCNGVNNEFNGVISPDGKYLAYVTRSDGPNNIWVKNLATKETRQFTFVSSGKNCTTPNWTPDGTQIVFFGVGVAPKPSVFVKSFTPF